MLDSLKKTDEDRYKPDTAFDNLTSLAAEVLGTPVSLFSVIDYARDRQVFRGETGLNAPWSDARETPLSHSFCQHVVSEEAPLIVDDAPKHPLVKDNLAIPDLDVIAYLGVPVRDETDTVVGALCIIDNEARAWQDQDRQKLEKLAACVEDTIKAHHALALSDALQESETLREELRDFAYAISHDLKSPVNSIGLILSELQTDDLEPEELDQMVGMASRTVTRMQTLIEDTLLFTRTLGEAPVPELFDVAGLVEEVQEDLLNTITAAGGSVETGTLHPLLACRSQISLLLRNLIENAMKYAHPDRPPVARIEMKRDDHVIELSVADNGKGIPSEHYERVFSLFQRLDDRDETSGSGIGLTLCRRIATNHGAELLVSSTPDEGSTFTLSIQRQVR